MSAELFVGPDADLEPTLWRWVDDKRWEPILRRCDLTDEHRDLWPLLVGEYDHGHPCDGCGFPIATNDINTNWCAEDGIHHADCWRGCRWCADEVARENGGVRRFA